MYANINCTIRHRTGREESYQNVRLIKETDDGEILSVRFVEPMTGQVYTDEFDAKDWRVVSIEHTEIPPSEQ